MHLLNLSLLASSLLLVAAMLSALVAGLVRPETTSVPPGRAAKRPL